MFSELGFILFNSIQLTFQTKKGLFSNFIHEFDILRKNVSKNVSVLVYQGLGLGLVSGRNSNVSVSSRSRGNVGRSWSRSRLGLKTKCLGLVSVSDLKVSFTTLRIYMNLCPEYDIEFICCVLGIWRYLDSSNVVRGLTVKLQPRLHFRACEWGCVRWKRHWDSSLRFSTLSSYSRFVGYVK